MGYNEQTHTKKDKTIYICFRTKMKNNNIHVRLHVKTQIIKLAEHTKFLGIYIEQNFDFGIGEPALNCHLSPMHLG